MQWEHWTIYGSSIDKALLINRKFPDKQFEASFERVLFTTHGALNGLFRSLNVNLKEKLCQAPSTHAHKISGNCSTQVHNVMVLDGDGCLNVETSSSLNTLIEQAFSAMIQEVGAARVQEDIRVERQYMEFECMLNAAYKKAQELEVQVNELHESLFVSQTEADQKLDDLQYELGKARLVAENAVANESKLKQAEEKYEYVANELILSKSLLHRMETSDKMARDEVEKLTLQYNGTCREVTELKELLNDNEAKNKVKERELLLKILALEEEVKKVSISEDNLKELLKKMEIELNLNRKRVAELESDLKATHGRKRVLTKEKQKQEFVNHPSAKLTVEHVPTSSKNYQDSVELTESSSTVAEAAKDGIHAVNSSLEELTLKKEQCYSFEKWLGLEAQVKESKGLIEQLRGQIMLLEEKEAHNQGLISELVAKLESSETENTESQTIISHMQQKVDEATKDCISLMEKLKRVEGKAEADMLRLKKVLESVTLSQFCTDMVTALVTLSIKIVKLEGTFQAFRSEYLSNSEASKLTVSALEIDLLCCKEVVSFVQSSLQDADDENSATGSRIESITRGFMDLQKQLTYETRRLET